MFIEVTADVSHAEMSPANAVFLNADCRLATDEVSHAEMFWSNLVAPRKMYPILVTLDVSQAASGLLKSPARRNMPSILVTCDASHSPISPLN